MKLQFLIFASILLIPNFCLAECSSNPLQYANSARAIVTGKVTQSPSAEEVTQNRAKNAKKPFSYEFTIQILEVLKGSVESPTLHFKFPTYGGEDDDQFVVDSEWVFLLEDVKDSEGTLFKTKCHASVISTDASDQVGDLQDILAVPQPPKK